MSLQLLYIALGTPIGIAISTPDPSGARAKLYQARSKANDPQLACLQFRISPIDPENELWIVKGKGNGKEE